MTLVEYFSFLPYGKYAFYVWFAYGVAFITVLTLFINAKINHKKTILQLKNKYLRSND
jgi:heme exporter protein D